MKRLITLALLLVFALSADAQFGPPIKGYKLIPGAAAAIDTAAQSIAWKFEDAVVIEGSLILTISATEYLVVSGTSPTFSVTDTDANTEYDTVSEVIDTAAVYVTFTPENDPEFDIVSILGASVFTVDSVGYSGWGTGDPDAVIHIVNANGPQLIITDTAGADSATFEVDGDGNLIIVPSGSGTFIGSPVSASRNKFMVWTSTDTIASFIGDLDAAIADQDSAVHVLATGILVVPGIQFDDDDAADIGAIANRAKDVFVANLVSIVNSDPQFILTDKDVNLQTDTEAEMADTAAVVIHTGSGYGQIDIVGSVDSETISIYRNVSDGFIDEKAGNLYLDGETGTFLSVGGTVQWIVDGGKIYPNIDDSEDLAANNRRIKNAYFANLVQVYDTDPEVIIADSDGEDGGTIDSSAVIHDVNSLDGRTRWFSDEGGVLSAYIDATSGYLDASTGYLTLDGESGLHLDVAGTAQWNVLAASFSPEADSTENIGTTTLAPLHGYFKGNVYVSREKTIAGTDSSIFMDVNTGAGRLNFRAGDGDAAGVTISTDDQLTFTGATGGYTFDDDLLLATTGNIFGNGVALSLLTTTADLDILLDPNDDGGGRTNVGVSGDTDSLYVYGEAWFDDDVNITGSVSAGAVTFTTVTFDSLYGDSGTIKYSDAHDSLYVTELRVDGTANLDAAIVAGNIGAATYGSDASISDAELLTLDDGAVTQILVGGGAGSAPVWGADIPTAVTIGTAYIYRAGGTDVPDADVADNITITNISQVQDITATAAEINYTTDVTGLIQAQIDLKAPLASPTFTGAFTSPGIDDNADAIAITIDVTTEKVNFSGNLDLDAAAAVLDHSGGTSFTISSSGAGIITIPDDVIMDNPGATVNSPSFYLRGDDGGVEEEFEMHLVQGADPYLRISIDDDNTTPALTAVLDIHDTIIAFATDNVVDIGAAADNRPKDIHVAGDVAVGAGITAAADITTSNGAIAAAVETVATLGVGAVTFAVDANVCIVTGDGGGNTVATITGGVAGQLLTLIFTDANVTIANDDAHGANTIDLDGANNFTSADDSVLQLVFDGTSWYKVSASVN